MTARPTSATRRLAPRSLWHLLAFGLLLLAAQQLAQAHWLEDAVRALHAHPELGAALDHCDTCDGMVALGAALPSPPPFQPPALVEPGAPLTARPADPLHPAVGTGYQARAPPLPTP